MSRIPLPSTASQHSNLNSHAPGTPTPTHSNSMYGQPRPSPASRPRPESVYSATSSSTAPTSVDGGHLAETRKRQSKRDEAIRKKIESELSRKRPGSKRSGPSQTTSRNAPRPKQGTVSALRPLPALTVPHSISVADASQLCAAKRTDCVLVVDEDEHLCGIFTAKDLAFRVVGDGLDPRSTPVSAIMTPNPMVTRDTTSATEALQTMVTRGFRHLPVCNEDGDVVGLLDITKVFNESLEKLEKAYGSSQKLYSALEGAQEQFGAVDPAQNPLMAYVQALRDKMSFPDLGSILDARTTAATVGVKTTVREAARLMRERRTTAVCVMENDGRKIAGIFTSKDVVLRVIAAGLDSKTCSVVRVMTPHPDVALPTLSIQDALRKMHTGHYLNLPVVDDGGALVGIVDVLKLTYATLEQVNSIGSDGQTTDPGQGPLWGRFFGGMVEDEEDDDESASVLSLSQAGGPMATPSRTGSQRPPIDTPGSEVFPHDSASAIYDDGASDVGGRQRGLPASSIGAAPVVDDGTYLFKFLAPSGTTHRFQARYDSYEFVSDIVAGKLSSDPFFAPLPPTTAGKTETQATTPDPRDFQLSYTDDDGDLVLITSDRDLTDAVATAKKQGLDRVVFKLRGGAAWEAELERRGAPKPNGREKLGKVDENEEAAEEGEEVQSEKKKKSKRRSAEEQADELVFGFLQKDQLLPASIAVLAAAIVGVFTASKFTGASR